jgi:2',3'-cyclic-nucleotide 2'-phosphodiesterase/3'-nucleotidase
MMTITIRAAAALLVLSAACAPAARTPAAAPAAGSATPAAATADTGTLVLLGTTDLHGWVLPYDYYTGKTTNNSLASLVPMIDSVRAANPGRTILVESGDLLQGNPLDFVYSRLEPGETHPLVAAMNLVGYDAAAIGNHEFDYGIPHLDQAVRQARFPWLSANTFRAGTAEHAYRAYTFVTRTVAGRPVKIGITSVTPPGVAIWDRDNVRGRLEFRDIVASVRPVVARMRAEGADLVVVAAHSGLEGSSYDTAATHVAAENAAVAMAQQVPGIDVILMGHTHREVADTTINGVLVQQAKNWAASLAVSTLTLSHGGDGWHVLAKHGRILRPVEGRVDARLQAALAQAHERTRQYVGRQSPT